MQNEKRERTVFLAVIRFGKENSNKTHVAEIAPKIRSLIERNSNNECKLAFSDPDGYSFGYLLKTELSPETLKNYLFGSTSSGCILRSDDNILILEVGEEYYGYGFSNAWTWLQHHHS
jgi:hypothetical protein